MFVREFDIPDILKIWDFILAGVLEESLSKSDSPIERLDSIDSFFNMDCLSLSMIISLKNQSKGHIF
jgi:hypothetical protein